MSEIIKRIFNNRIVKTIIDVSMRVDIVTASSSIAYFGLLSIFPAIIIIATLLPYFGLTISTALSYVQMAVPTSVYDFARPIIESILGQKGVGVLSASIIITLWSLSRVVASIRTAQNGIYGVQPKTIAIIDRFISMAWMILVLGIMGILLIIASVGSNILEALPISANLVQQIESAKSPVVIGGLFIGASLFNWVLPVKKPRLQWALVGTTVQVALVIWLTKIFGWYVSLASQAYTFYQALSSAIILLLWINFIALAALIGTIVTATLEELFPSQNDKLAVIQTFGKSIIRKNGKK
ncbi:MULTISPECIES: YihY/virulence factor BrkB family protein [Weissella]|uniref:YihY/virulence factor BrkB family protein n=1 Tax=Weissella TaxID=46255 RepID=UPI000BFFE1E9|nr:YihY/virulence factor BrkB family protein [Weissella cibaria]